MTAAAAKQPAPSAAKQPVASAAKPSAQAANAADAAADAPAKAKRSFKLKLRLPKKLVIVLIAAVVLLAVAGGGTVFVLKKRAAVLAAAEGLNGNAAGPAAAADATAAHDARPDPDHPPTFLPLDVFVVNLADRQEERYAQIGITLQVDSPEVADQLKAYMPAIRNGVLMLLAQKTSEELLGRAGKEQLAAEIMREAVRPLGIEIDAPAAHGATAPAGRKARRAPVHNPVQHVHFSSFIIQ